MYTSEADFHKPGIYGGRVRVWATELDVFQCTPSRGVAVREIYPQQPGDRDHLETRAVKRVPLGSPYSHSSSIDLGFVEIGFACTHTYVYTRTAAAAAPPVYVLVFYTFFWPAQLRLSLL